MMAALQMVAGLAIVLAAIAGAAWVARRVGFNPAASHGLIKFISSQTIGPKERVVIVEVGGQWLVLGVAPGRVSSLASLPAGEAPVATQQAFDFKKLFQKAKDHAAR